MRLEPTASQTDPAVLSGAPLEFRRAAEALERADRALVNGEQPRDIDYYAYVATRRAQTAMALAAAKSDEAAIKTVEVDRERARADVRTLEAQAARADADAQRLQAAAATQQAAVAQQQAQARLAKLSEFLKQFPERKILIEGHADNVGSAAYNDQLSTRRAESIRAQLVLLGIAPDRITTIGYGKDYPIAANDSDTNRALNRRVEVYISETEHSVRPRR